MTETQEIEKLEFILGVLDDMKAVDVEVYHVSGKTILADDFVVCTGNSSTQTRAIADEVHHRCKSRGWLLGQLEGHDNPSWKILDYGDVVLHVFLPETRAYYKLEEIWGEGRHRGDVDQENPVIQKMEPRPRAGEGATAQLKKRRKLEADQGE